MLKHWFPYEKINWSKLCQNPSRHAIHLLSLPENFDKIDWCELSYNSNAIDLLLKYPEKIVWKSFCANRNTKAVEMIIKAFQNGDVQYFCWLNICSNHCPDIFPLLEYIIETVIEENTSLDDYIFQLSANPVATPIFLRERNFMKISWAGLSLNPSKEAIELLSKRENRYRLQRQYLSLNPSAIPLLIREAEFDPYFIYWHNLSLNSSSEAIELLEKNFDRIVWNSLTGNSNPKAFEIIKKNPNKVFWASLFDNPYALDFLYDLYKKAKGDTRGFFWSVLSANPDIFVEWEKIEKRPFEEELIQEALSPERVSKIYEITGSLEGFI